MQEKIRVLIVDDHIVLREGVKKVLTTEPIIEVVGEASNGNEAIQMADEFMPDVILMDLFMPGCGGVQAIQKIYSQSPHIRIVILTASGSRQDLIDGIKSGAIGYMVKDLSKEKLISAVKSAYRNEAIISSSVATDLLDEFKKLIGSKPASENKVAVLSDREQEILKLMAEGLDNKAIAKKIFVSESTVKNHVSNILTKLQLENRVQAGVLAAKEGLV